MTYSSFSVPFFLDKKGCYNIIKMRPFDHFLRSLIALRLVACLFSIYCSPASEDTCAYTYVTCSRCECQENEQSLACSGNVQCIFNGSGVFTNVTSLRLYDEWCRLELETVVIGNRFPLLQEVTFKTITFGYGFGIERVPDGVFKGLSDLKRVRFISSFLGEIPTTALERVANSLNELTICYQFNIREFPSKGFANFAHLTTLTINRTSIHSLNSDSLLGLNNLRVLNLESNMIKFVAEDAFVHTGKLVSLKIGDNSIRVIPSSVDQLLSLEVLDMNKNNVSKIRDFRFLSYMPNIKILNLRHNDISLVGDTATKYLENSSVGISGLCDNHYTCEGELCSFMHYVIRLPNITDVDYPWGGSQICNFDCFSPLEHFSYTRSFRDAYTDTCGRTTGHSGVSVVIKQDTKSVNIIGVALGVVASCGIISGILVYFALRRLRRLRRGYIFAGLGNVLPNDIQHPDIKFDALVYHHNDEARFVEERLRPRLEEDPNDFRLCLPLLRDFRLGAKRLNNLRESLVSSRCAIFVISHAFVQDARCKQAFEVACDYLHRDDLGPPHLKQTGLILLLLDPVLLDRLPEVLRVLVDRLVTLEWDNLAEERCWNRLEQNLRNFKEAENEDNVERQ